MSDLALAIINADFPDFLIRSITKDDLELLRHWKNKNKSFFFLKTDITEEQQQNWYTGFCNRPHDFMFIAEEVNSIREKVGCMGFRVLEDDSVLLDAYNIMRFERTINRSYSMADIFKTMLKYAVTKYPEYIMSVKVLKTNPAIQWYTEKIGFDVVIKGDEYYVFHLDKHKLDNIIVHQQ